MSARVSVIELTMRVNGILNARYVQALARLGERWQPQAGEHEVLDTSMLERLKRFPVLLVDCHFDDAGWWDQHLALQAAPIAGEPHRDERVELGRDVLTALWCLLDDGPEFHCLTGIAPAVMAIWDRAGFTRLVDTGRAWCAEFQPRWADVPAFWHRLQCAATREHEWEALQLQALRLCGRCRT